MSIFTDIESALTEAKDEKFALLTQKTIPTLNKESFIGVRTPDLRKLAKNLQSAMILAIFSQLSPTVSSRSISSIPSSSQR
ncbi:hypothetical protein SAMN02910353_00331 [Ruminococcus sp. YRD2003]|uniref:hypothetical protein n=1 Tax=Ruminococcus sp. YRD2003 TaxID=1452313 RepID=UPI0008D38542|nr:hypothetical protein SAMN02910353_00331 [Ruminococcus flavefaciens]